MSNFSVYKGFTKVLCRCPVVIHSWYEWLNNRCCIECIILCCYKSVAADCLVCKKLCVARNHTSHLIVSFLCICASKVASKSYSNLWVFAVRVYTDCFGSCKGFQLFLFSIDSNGWKRCYAKVIAKCFFHCCCIPGS